MTYVLARDNGEVVILSEKELNSIYTTARIAWLKDYVVDMLNWKGYDSESMTDEQIEEITGAFVKTVTESDSLGDLENDAFEATMDCDFPEIKKEDE